MEISTKESTLYRRYAFFSLITGASSVAFFVAYFMMLSTMNTHENPFKGGNQVRLSLFLSVIALILSIVSLRKKKSGLGVLALVIAGIMVLLFALAIGFAYLAPARTVVH